MQQGNQLPQTPQIQLIRVDYTQKKDQVEFHGWAEVVTEYWIGGSVTYTRKFIREIDS
jgi:hypothetical protein